MTALLYRGRLRLAQLLLALAEALKATDPPTTQVVSASKCDSEEGLLTLFCWASYRRSRRRAVGPGHFI
jgi:hypothetical protein